MYRQAIPLMYKGAASKYTYVKVFVNDSQYFSPGKVHTLLIWIILGKIHPMQKIGNHICMSNENMP